MFRHQYLIFILFCASILQSASAQSCQENLLQASKLLNAGKFTDCINNARACTLPTTNISERWQAFRLMSIAYSAMGNADSARYFAENMLELNPTYKVNPLYDPKDFSKILNGVIIIPKFTLGLAMSMGGNTTLCKITDSYAPGYYSKNYQSGNSFLINSNIGLRLNPFWGLQMGLQASGRSYSLNYTVPNWEVHVSEKLTYLEVPVCINHYFKPIKRFQFQAQAGIQAGYLLKSQNDFHSKNTITPDEISLTRINSKDRRNLWNYSFVLGTGLNYKTNQGYLKLEAAYNRGLNNITNAENRYSYTDQIYNYYYLDDDLKLSNFSLSMGYMYIVNYKIFRKHQSSLAK